MPYDTNEQTADVANSAQKTTRIAICGEIRSGKSTVLNALLRDRLLPDNLGADLRPEITVRWRASAGVDMVRTDGSTETLDYIDGPDALRGAERIEIWSNRRHIRSFEFLEVPMTTAEDLTDAQFDAVQSADVLVWVTIASQAWRLTERKILDELAEVRPQRAILAISRSDKLRNDRDRAKLMDRVRRETVDYVDDVLFICGARDTLERAGKSKKDWQRTGGPDLLGLLEGIRDGLGDAPVHNVEEAAEAEVAVDVAAEPEAPAEAEMAFDAAEDQVAETAPEADMAFEADEDVVAEIEVIVDAPAIEVEAAESDAPRSVEELLRDRSAAIEGAAVIGMLAPDPDLPCAVFLGGDDDCEKAGRVARASLDVVARAWSQTEETGALSDGLVATMRHQLLYRKLPDGGLLYLMSGENTLTLGAAQKAMRQLCDGIF